MEGILKPIHRIGIGPCNNHEVGVLPGINGGAYFLDHLVKGNNLLALHMAAFLGPELVLDVNGGHSCSLILADRATHIDRVAIACIGISDERSIANNGSEGCGPAHHLAHGQEADIGLTEHTGRCAEAGHVHGRKSCLSNEACAKGIVGPGSNKQIRLSNQFTQARSNRHSGVLCPGN